LFDLPPVTPAVRPLAGGQLDLLPVYAGWKGVNRRAIIAPIPAATLAEWAEDDKRERPATYYDGKAVA
jgi:hypothetical protein